VQEEGEREELLEEAHLAPSWEDRRRKEGWLASYSTIGYPGPGICPISGLLGFIIDLGCLDEKKLKFSYCTIFVCIWQLVLMTNLIQKIRLVIYNQTV
jgi:hypothetical protein